ncbi:MAG: di-heme oxidoredictase family protein [Cellvibrio sp.]|uniref:di-heme oxidoredictase family protein n=1 Tax=Cellvibrio sp. TaxID=1965322 RepID=UPI0031AB85F1
MRKYLIVKCIALGFGALTLISAAAGSSGAVLTPIKAVASSVERGNLSADKVLDNNLSTRWGSGFSDDQWIYLDFGESVSFSNVTLYWQSAYAKNYQIQVSSNANNWNTLKAVNGSAGGVESIDIVGTGRYLRVLCLKRSSQSGYSIFEIKTLGVVNGSGNLSSSAQSASVSSTASSDDGLLGPDAPEDQPELPTSSSSSSAQSVSSSGPKQELPLLNTSALEAPTSGDGLKPLLPVTQEPLESTRFTLADGTLVTRFGVVGRHRHARERGEAWNEIGYGRNETFDAAGNPFDKGPGHYLDFVKNYFKKRTWGVEIIDNSRVAGVTDPTLRINQYFQQDQLPGGRGFFRAFSQPGTSAFGWMSPGKLADQSLYGQRDADGELITNCRVVPLPPNGRLLRPDTVLNDGCSATVQGYPSHAGLTPDANGVLARLQEVPNATQFYDYSVSFDPATGKLTTGLPVATADIKKRPLKVGDVVEVTSSFFSKPKAMAPDTGGNRYYTTELSYVVGVGLRPWYGIQPRLNNAPLPDEVLQGGIGSVSYDYADNGHLMFQQQQNNIGIQNMQRFVDGRRLLHSNMTTGEHNEPGNDRLDAVIGLQGPTFNQSSCFGCHINNGRSPAPATINQRLDKMAIRTAMITNGKQLPDSRYGLGVQMNRLGLNNELQDTGNSVRLAGFDVQTVNLADGTVVELRKPRLSFDGPVPQITSLRAAQPIIGTGLLEAVPEADILARVRSTPDQDGVKGLANFVFDPETGDVRLGRFGWKAGKVSLRHQSAAAALQDMSVTSPIYPSLECLAGPATCKTGNLDEGLSEDELQKIYRYVALVAVPAQRSLVSGFPKGVAPLADLDVDPVKIAAGAKIFTDIRCSSCHTTEMKTGGGHELEELRNQTIKPYTDLLLHDMGPGLADNFIESMAPGHLWRTAPLWGIGYTTKVMENQGAVGYLHDGRARNLTEAIMWHGGEGAKSRDRFASLSATDRRDLLTFLQSL